MTAKAADDNAHSGQWAETSHCRVSAVRRFGAFTALELVAPGVTANASPGQFVMVTVPGGAFVNDGPKLTPLCGFTKGSVLHRQ